MIKNETMRSMVQIPGSLCPCRPQQKPCTGVLLCTVTEAGEKIGGLHYVTTWIIGAVDMGSLCNVSMISWMLLIHDIAVLWIKAELSLIQIRWFSKWLGCPHRGN